MHYGNVDVVELTEPCDQSNSKFQINGTCKIIRLNTSELHGVWMIKSLLYSVWLDGKQFFGKSVIVVFLHSRFSEKTVFPPTKHCLLYFAKF